MAAQLYRPYLERGPTGRYASAVADCVQELNSGLMAELTATRKRLASRTAELNLALAKQTQQPQQQQGSAPAPMPTHEQPLLPPEPDPVSPEAPPPHRRPSSSKGIVLADTQHSCGMECGAWYGTDGMSCSVLAVLCFLLSGWSALCLSVLLCVRCRRVVQYLQLLLLPVQ